MSLRRALFRAPGSAWASFCALRFAARGPLAKRSFVVSQLTQRLSLSARCAPRERTGLPYAAPTGARAWRVTDARGSRWHFRESTRRNTKEFRSLPSPYSSARFHPSKPKPGLPGAPADARSETDWATICRAYRRSGDGRDGLDGPNGARGIGDRVIRCLGKPARVSGKGMPL